MKEIEIRVYEGTEVAHSKFTEGQEWKCDGFFSVMARRKGVTRIEVRTTITEVYEEAQLQRLRRFFAMPEVPDNE